MKTWHYNVVDIIKDPEFRQALVECLERLEGTKKHDIVLSMLSNYFNHRNKGFTSNWLYLPESRVTLYIGREGIYFKPEFSIENNTKTMLDKLNLDLYKAIGRRSWIVTFTKTKPPILRSADV
mgnify:CR=1 FL=1|tara:strand:- start:15274 stop:15642 length:369 start_codon:yes stop_codon:yes gene_type:complete